MDASASDLHTHDADIYSYGLFTKSKNPSKQKNTVIKYTKLPEFDMDSNALWTRHSYAVQPRLRRFVSFEEPISISERSLKSEILEPKESMETNLPKRKIVTIIEDTKCESKPKLSNSKKTYSEKMLSRAVTAELKEPKFEITDKKLSNIEKSYKQNTLTKNLKESKRSAKLNKSNEIIDLKPKSRYKIKPSNRLTETTENSKHKSIWSKDAISKSRLNVNKSNVPQSESAREVLLIKSKLSDSLKTKSSRKPNEKSNLAKSNSLDNKNKHLLNIPRKSHYETLPVIHVPLDVQPKKKSIAVAVQSDEIINTNPPEMRENSSSTKDLEPQIIYKYLQSTDVQTELIKETYDSLEIPNVTLTQVDSVEEFKPCSSISNISLESIKPIEDDASKTNVVLSTSYIISRATLTYTTKQKFNLEVVGSNNDAYSNQTPSPLPYPINVVSVFKNELQSEDSDRNITVNKNTKENSKNYKNRINDIKSLDCSYDVNSEKLMKPSDIISKIRVNNSLLRDDFVCQQFQRELSFIDSFFESLQYLESSLADKGLSNNKKDAMVSRHLIENAAHSEYDSFVSYIGNDENQDDAETMASKNLFLLNILIRDEQRRAKNILFVLKRREDALKDFTKSQILYLENKKRQDNTDISALKKKQRGALLKLQHECGEMQRMRRALLTLSDKRKLTLMKTKKALELKLKNNVVVDKIMLGKKKIKRSASAERASPLKCFDLSSSCCEDSSTSTKNSVDSVSLEQVCVKPALSAEKSIQTGDGSLEDQTNILNENFIIVDGRYLNILFQNLSLPQIFSGTKQYEVNEPALKNIVETSNTKVDSTRPDAEKMHTQINNPKNNDNETASTPSTARSLLDEFDHYYKALQRKSIENSPPESENNLSVCELKEASIQIDPTDFLSQEQSTSTETLINTCDSATGDKIDCKDDTHDNINDYCGCEVNDCRDLESIENICCDSDTIGMDSKDNVGFELVGKEVESREVPMISPTGPLPVPAGEAASIDPPVISDSPLNENDSILAINSHTTVTTLCEAEELRRQQLAIEKEIKELEQQQNRMSVREIPDKPPPPYTPPADSRPPAPPRKYQVDEGTSTRISMYVDLGTGGSVEDFPVPTDAYDVFVHDFCQEAMDRTRRKQSELPWEGNTPSLRPVDETKRADAVTTELTEVLAGAKPTLVCGVSAKRSDHIDDVLFTEWRRLEPEWTSLHQDEVIVKNIIFDNIFQKILNDTVDEYKRTTLSEDIPND